MRAERMWLTTAAMDHIDFIRPVRLGEILVTLEVERESCLHQFNGSGRKSVGGKYADR